MRKIREKKNGIIRVLWPSFLLAATAMIVGAQTLARALDDATHKTRLVEACRSHLDTLPDTPAAPAQPSFLWAADPPDERDAQRHPQPPAPSLH